MKCDAGHCFVDQVADWTPSLNRTGLLCGIIYHRTSNLGFLFHLSKALFFKSNSGISSPNKISVASTNCYRVYCVLYSGDRTPG